MGMNVGVNLSAGISFGLNMGLCYPNLMVMPNSTTSGATNSGGNK